MFLNQTALTELAKKHYDELFHTNMILESIQITEDGQYKLQLYGTHKNLVAQKSNRFELLKARYSVQIPEDYIDEYFDYLPEELGNGKVYTINTPIFSTWEAIGLEEWDTYIAQNKDRDFTAIIEASQKFKTHIEPLLEKG